MHDLVHRKQIFRISQMNVIKSCAKECYFNMLPYYLKCFYYTMKVYVYILN